MISVPMLHFQPSSILHPANSMTLLQELQAMLQARSGTGLLPRNFEGPMPSNSPEGENNSGRTSTAAAAPDAKENGTSEAERARGETSDTNGV